jgi:hypothetical protein
MRADYPVPEQNNWSGITLGRFYWRNEDQESGSQETPVQAATLCVGNPWSASERNVIAAGSVYILRHQYPPFIFRYHTRTILWNTVKSMSTPRFVPDFPGDMIGVEVRLFMQRLTSIIVRDSASPRHLLVFILLPQRQSIQRQPNTNPTPRQQRYSAKSLSSTKN